MPNKAPTDAAKLRRSFAIGFIAFRYFVFYKINSLKNLSLGERLRFACESLGPIFIKLGQILSTRYDLLEKSDCEALQKLLDSVPPISYAEVSTIFTSDFGKSPKELFREFSEVPIASASMAQVYRAITKNGDEVAVKVRRPNITKNIRSDIVVLKRLIKMAEIFSGDLRHIKANEVLSQLESWIFSEADFKQEAKNIKILTRFYSERANNGDEFAASLVFPKIYSYLCSDNVITMDFLHGIPANKFDSAVSGNEYDALASLTAVLGSSVRAWMERKPTFFHADPHPANILIMKNGRAGLLDFGLIGWFDKRIAEDTCDLLMAVYSQNLDLTTKCALKLCRASNDFDTPQLRKDITDYLKKTKTSGMGYWFMGYIKIFIKHRIPLPYQLTLFGRGNAIVEGLFETTVPGKTTLEVMGRELQRGLYKQIFNNIISIDISPIVYTLSEKLKESPANVARTIQKYFDHPLDFIRDVKEEILAK